MKLLQIASIGFVAAFGLAGCVIVLGDDGIEASEGFHVNDRHSDADSVLADKVRDALRAEPLLKGADLTVSARDGVVTLRGSVSELPAFDRALQVARTTPGVDKVVSRIRVEVR